MKIAFIGTGNMGGALARAVRAALPETELYLSDRSREKAEALAEEIGAEVLDNVTAAERADYLFLGVKPQMLENLAKEIGGITSVRHNELTLVSMAAGVPIERINSLFGKNVPVIRIMPNTPVSVGKGLVLWCTNGTVQTGGKQDFRAMLAKAGVLSELPEGLIDAGCALSGCGPAFVCLFLEAMADGAVTCRLWSTRRKPCSELPRFCSIRESTRANSRTRLAVRRGLRLRAFGRLRGGRSARMS